MANYGLKAHKGNANVSTVVYLAGGTRRLRIYDWAIGCGDTPGDAEFIHVAIASSSPPTGNAITPFAIDPADTASVTGTYIDTVTVDGGMPALFPMFRKALNQRATFRWVAAPYGELLFNGNAGTLGFDYFSFTTTTSFDYDVYFSLL